MGAERRLHCQRDGYGRRDGGHGHLGRSHELPNVGINIVGAGGEDEIGAIGTDGSTDWRSGEPKVWAYCYVSAKAKTTMFYVGRSTGSVPISYVWRLH